LSRRCRAIAAQASEGAPPTPQTRRADRRITPAQICYEFDGYGRPAPPSGLTTACERQKLASRINLGAPKPGAPFCLCYRHLMATILSLGKVIANELMREATFDRRYWLGQKALAHE
jgi:hypothetical protein